MAGTLGNVRDVNLRNRNLTSIPFNFYEINGRFDIGYNRIESLKGCPKYCHDFDCSYNTQLKSLSNGPTETMNYIADSCGLINLDYLASDIRGDLHINNNILLKNNIENIISIISGNIHCCGIFSKNPKINLSNVDGNILWTNIEKELLEDFDSFIKQSIESNISYGDYITQNYGISID